MRFAFKANMIKSFRLYRFTVIKIVINAKYESNVFLLSTKALSQVMNSEHSTIDLSHATRIVLLTWDSKRICYLVSPLLPLFS